MSRRVGALLVTITQDGTWTGEPRGTGLGGRRNGLELFRPYTYRGGAALPEPAVGPGLCACGCGAAVARAAKTDRRTGQIKGEFLRYSRGHSGRCIRNSAGNAA